MSWTVLARHRYNDLTCIHALPLTYNNNHTSPYDLFLILTTQLYGDIE